MYFTQWIGVQCLKKYDEQNACRRVFILPDVFYRRNAQKICFSIKDKFIIWKISQMQWKTLKTQQEF